MVGWREIFRCKSGPLIYDRDGDNVEVYNTSSNSAIKWEEMMRQYLTFAHSDR